ncbi:hypothetical protein [Streptomyces mutabilis]|uniref:Uncharacterized protein n=1 Tax=Streptomyces mutabilis TaxID=67332 RepID=A0A086MZR8_9ACTN|nr:hypothetical protein [Streptomyces mutabilis]KFG74386.1 hypothetical protein FM21_26925 [Streptomyces mutabilis]
MTDKRDSWGTDRPVSWLPYGVAAMKGVFALALFRLFATPFSEEMFGEQWLPMPTWEWTLASLTPVLLIVVARRPADWSVISGERTTLRIALIFYLAYGLAFAAFQGKTVLRLSVAAGLGGLAGMRLLARKEPAHGS